MDPGTPLPRIERELDPDRLVMYLGATWDWHVLHYDPDHVAAVELPAPIADGQMFAAFYAEQLVKLLGPSVELRSLSFRFHSMVLAGDTVGLTGEVTSATDDAAGTTVEARHQLMVGERRCSTARSIAWVPA